MIWVILAASFILRLIVINQSLWLDEAIGAMAARDFSFFGILNSFPKFDNHPPLYYLLLKGWTSLFGFSEISLRFPSIIFGVATVYLTYLIARHFVGKKEKFFPMFCALLLATSPLHIYYSQEARMYAMAAFLAVVAVHSFLKEKWILFSFSLAVLVFSDYVPVFLLPVFWIIGFIDRKPRQWWKKLLLSHIPIMILGLFWLPIFLAQSQAGKWLLSTLPAWKNVAGGATFKQAVLVWMKFVLGRISLMDKTLYYGLVAFFSIPFIVSFVRAWNKRQKVLSIWLYLIIPLILGFLTSIIFPAFIYFRFLYVLPAFYILAGWGISQYGKKIGRVLLLGILAGNLIGWLIYVKNPYQQREKWREAVEFLEARARGDEIVVFEYPEPFTPYRWYQTGRVEASGATDAVSANPEKTRQLTLMLTKDRKAVYYFEYLWDLSDPGRVVESTLVSSGFAIKEIYDYFPGVGQIKYFTKK